MTTDMNLYSQMLATAQSVNALLQDDGEFNLISRDTAAKILAIVYIQSGDERIVTSPKVRLDLRYIQDRYHINGSEIPDAQLVEYLQHYTKEIETHIKDHDDFPQWAYDLFQQRYKFKLYKP